jgi:hypothetical protein
MPLPRIPKRGATGEVARLITSQFNVTTPDGLVLNQSPTGQQWLDQVSKPFPARITGDGSGSGNSGGWGSGYTGWADFDHHYDWEEVIPVTIANELKFVTKENGRNGTSSVRPAVEANGVPDVPIDAIVWLYPGTIEGQEPTWYFFWWAGDLGSGSGGSSTVTCSDGTVYPVTINGTSIVVGDPL